MSQAWTVDALQRPISDAQPCGEDIEYTLLPELDAMRVFGHSTPYEQAPDWAKVQDRSLAALQKSKDLRVLAHLGAAALRVDGIGAYADTLTAAAGWLETFWSGVYPLVDEDAMVRRNALNCFADPMAALDGLRRAPLVSSRQHGVFSLRDAEIAAGQIPAPAEEAVPDQAQLSAAFAEMPLADLEGLIARVKDMRATLGRIDAQMQAQGGDSGSGFDGLNGQLGRIVKVLEAQRAAHPDAVNVAVEGDEAEGGQRVGLGPVKSPQDAIRLLDAVADFFRRTEPSSPVPLIVDRAKRLVSKDFLEVLAEIAPEALPSARSAGGLKD
jgi:type VI secretion system protein ImpA